MAKLKSIDMSKVTIRYLLLKPSKDDKGELTDLFVDIKAITMLRWLAEVGLELTIYMIDLIFIYLLFVCVFGFFKFNK